MPLIKSATSFDRYFGSLNSPFFIFNWVSVTLLDSNGGLPTTNSYINTPRHQISI